MKAVVKKGVFEIVPYFSRPDIKGVPSGGHSAEQLKSYSEKWWKGTMETARKIKAGDAITIGYQGDITTLEGYRMAKIIGWGMLQQGLQK